ncbi:hypothetical protein [Citrobacter portucalensis]|uniref:hypothetical protein n=1 Tax=Citrobacter portucalensis TaxID=1639133 RepID=UPI00388E4F43
MKKYYIMLVLLFPMMSYATCSGTQDKDANISFTLTDQGETKNFNTNFDGSFSCYSSGDKIYIANSLQDYIVELQNSSGGKSIYIKLNASVGGMANTYAGFSISQS